MQTLLPFERNNSKEIRQYSSSTAVPSISSIHLTNSQRDISKAEHALLELADYIYAHTSLKPISKTLFVISRCLLVARKGMEMGSLTELRQSYAELCSSLGSFAPVDDFDFQTVLSECEAHSAYILDTVRQVASLTSDTDSLGLAFNTLLRGKFEGGEGLGTFLTPEEVADPMVRMSVGVVAPEMVRRLISGPLPICFGDICGGTGRFVYALYRLLRPLGLQPERAEKTARLFDQSSLAVEFGRLNFLFDSLSPQFQCVSDSLTTQSVSDLRNSFALLATNPPFGTGKYRWRSELEATFPPKLLRVLGLKGRGDVADPSEVFLFRNLDLLADGGVLAIVLPDGVIQSRRFVSTLRTYEDLSNVNLSIAAMVSLPVSTFSLGGTVAKTSFLIIRKNSGADELPLYVAIAKHVGFIKKGNRRLPDPLGNDLPGICADFLSGTTAKGVTVNSWRTVSRLVSTAICHAGSSSAQRGRLSPLRKFVSPVREYENVVPESVIKKRFHISILDVDETGLIEIIAATRNRPITRSLRCKPGDILVSCINPKIWRATCVPMLEGVWTCSPEFVALRPTEPKDAWGIYLALHHTNVIRAVQAMAGGTSSSRQRVEKEQLLEISIDARHLRAKATLEHSRVRTRYYKVRLREAVLYQTLHGNEVEDATEHSPALRTSGL